MPKELSEDFISLTAISFSSPVQSDTRSGLSKPQVWSYRIAVITSDCRSEYQGSTPCGTAKRRMEPLKACLLAVSELKTCVTVYIVLKIHPANFFTYRELSVIGSSPILPNIWGDSSIGRA